MATSLVVREELQNPGYPAHKRRDALALISELPLLDINAPIERIVQEYVENLLMPRQPTADALHLAPASYYACDMLLTWNCIHLANPNKFRHIEAINKRLGLPTPAVVTPLQLLGDAV
ncbi:MAG: DNA-binding protein [Verrucomicrobiota bacterium]